MWRLSAVAYRIADLISSDGNRASAPFARLGHWFERSRVRWFPGQFSHQPSDE
jgi:hypothetical protein